MSSIFTQIINGNIPCHEVWQDDHHLAFLDIRPVKPGHCLVIPKEEISHITDLTPEAHAQLWKAVHLVSRKLKMASGCERVVMMVVGWEVPHVHVHLIPTNSGEDVAFPDPCDFDQADFPNWAQRISSAAEA
ncbi:HIT family protein [Planctomycetota bacterium]|nr:HIT family protein [Planctomycetota bacterium]MDC0346973.1 HIT family protein [Planctomycetota bacterium]MDC0648198.1 HIT family protein [bacterium]MDC0852738.1 HIT family protein [Planctomycetota bacterium]